MQHYAPHAGAKFEGHYSKFDLPSGDHIALIVCTVPKAKHRPHMVSFSFVPKDGTSPVFQREIWANELHMIKTSSRNDFDLRVPGTGYICCQDGVTTYEVDHADFHFRATTSSRTAWDEGLFQTPEGPLVYLPLPLHWHVHSLASKCEVNLKSPVSNTKGPAFVHEEKNWSNSFPTAHMWIQARNHAKGTGINIAGGKILGVLEAYLLGYRSADINIDARPPVSLGLAGVYSPLMTAVSDWSERTFSIGIRTSWNQRIHVSVTAPKGTFFGLSSPFSDGHRENFLGQSFKAMAHVKVYETPFWSLWQPWKIVHEERFEDASLEFGGQYYPPAGSEQRSN